MNRKFSLPVSSLQAIAKWRYAIAFALVLTILGQAKQVSGSDVNLNNLNNLNGLFTPTAAQRFFEKGIENFEKEVRILVRVGESDVTGNILKIQTEFDESEVPETIIDSEVTKTSSINSLTTVLSGFQEFGQSTSLVPFRTYAQTP